MGSAGGTPHQKKKKKINTKNIKLISACWMEKGLSQRGQKAQARLVAKEMRDVRTFMRAYSAEVLSATCLR